MLRVVAVAHEIVVVVSNVRSAGNSQLVQVGLKHVNVANGKRGGTLELLNLLTVQLGLTLVGVLIVRQVLVHFALDVLAHFGSDKLAVVVFPAAVEVLS